MGKYCFGIDVGGTSVKCGLFQTDGILIEKWEIPTRKENNGEAILPDIAKTILDKIEERKLDKAEIDGVGIGVPGPVNDKGEVLCAVNLFWGFKAVTKELTELTGLPSMAGNDANVAALGEAWKGAAAGAKNVIMVTLGTGVGGGIILDSRIISGSHGATDEESVLRGFSRLSAKNVLDAYKEGDKLAAKVMDEVGEKLGSALAVFACVVDPEAIVIGGGVSRAGQPLIDCIETHYKKYAFSACKETPIILAKLGNDAGIYGSARMVI